MKLAFINRSLRLKVSLGVCLALIILLAPLNWLQYELQRRAAMREMELLAASTSAIVARGLEESMLTNNRSTIQAIVDDAAQASGVRSIHLLTLQGKVAASSDSRHNGEQLDRAGDICQDCHQFPVQNRPRGIVVADADGQSVFRTMTPIENREVCHECHSPEDRLNGVFYMDFSMTGFNARLEQSLRNAFLGSVTIIVLSAVVLNVLLSRLVITPMERVARGLQSFSQGRRETRVPVQTHDEVGLLSGVFNEMADTIQTQETEADRLYTELKDKDEIRRQLLVRLTTAQEEERKRIAREIHDELGQLLTGLSLNLKLCQQAVPDDFQAAHDHLSKTNNLVGHTIEQAHNLITRLRPTVLDDWGLVPALQDELSQRLDPLGIDTHLGTDGNPEQLSPEMTTATFRIVQEALTNIIRHANARRVHVRLQRTTDELIVTVEDDGVGLLDEDLHNPNGPQGLGILGMQERADALGGRLEVAHRQSGGMRVTLRLPLDDSHNVFTAHPR